MLSEYMITKGRNQDFKFTILDPLEPCDINPNTPYVLIFRKFQFRLHIRATLNEQLSLHTVHYPTQVTQS